MSVDVESLPYSPPDPSGIDLPPPIPPKLFLFEELFPPSSKLSEREEPHWNITPLCPVKANQQGEALTPHPPIVHRQSGEQ